MNKTNLIVDSAIFLAFLVAMEPRFSGLVVHEWLSLALAAAIVAHLLLHWKWIIQVGGQFFKKLWHSSRLKFVVDLLLFVAFTSVMMSGIMISRSVLPTLGLEISSGHAWRQVHSLSANLGILLVGLHVALSWKWIVTAMKNYVFSPLSRLFRPATRPQPVPVPVTASANEKRQTR